MVIAVMMEGEQRNQDTSFTSSVDSKTCFIFSFGGL